MKEKKIYVAEDGEIFDNEVDCLEWEKLSPIIKDLNEVLVLDDHDDAYNLILRKVVVTQEDAERGYLFPFNQWLARPASGSEQLKFVRELQALAARLSLSDVPGPL